MKRKVAAPVRPPAPDWEQLEETQKFPETCWTGLVTGAGGKDSNEAMAFAAKVQGFKWRPNGRGFALWSNKPIIFPMEAGPPRPQLQRLLRPRPHPRSGRKNPPHAPGISPPGVQPCHPRSRPTAARSSARTSPPPPRPARSEGRASPRVPRYGIRLFSSVLENLIFFSHSGRFCIEAPASALVIDRRLHKKFEPRRGRQVCVVQDLWVVHFVRLPSARIVRNQAVQFFRRGMRKAAAPARASSA